ncbi:hypothetical protein EVAR_59073_1 [Eumeta japonica]|uniref:Uncharacterized protein n=1 Tax=Eumeta variegata TaxID=151549 RepID=A0A4C1YCV0_EUMVA|nr:hypothetical protein EVAR_59073_1 [Eumeta japonica]
MTPTRIDYNAVSFERIPFSAFASPTHAGSNIPLNNMRGRSLILSATIFQTKAFERDVGYARQWVRVDCRREPTSVREPARVPRAIQPLRFICTRDGLASTILAGIIRLSRRETIQKCSAVGEVFSLINYSSSETVEIAHGAAPAARQPLYFESCETCRVSAPGGDWILIP